MEGLRHTDRHPSFVEGCFGCKLSTLSFGTVPGAYRATNSQSYYDGEALKQMDWPSREEIEDNRAEVRQAPLQEETFFVPDPIE